MLYSMAFHEEKLLSVAKDKGGIGGDSPPNLENSPFQRPQLAVQCISVGHLTGPRTI